MARRGPRQPGEGQAGQGEAEDGRRRDRLTAPEKPQVETAPRRRERGTVSPMDPDSAQTTWAVLVAAGTGERLGADRPKAFAALAGRPLLAESLERLDASDWIDAIV